MIAGKHINRQPETGDQVFELCIAFGAAIFTEITGHENRVNLANLQPDGLNARQQTLQAGRGVQPGRYPIPGRGDMGV